jgi:hypothetical protein
MKRLKLIPLAAALAALSACHQGGVGVDSGASQKAATASEKTLQSERSVQQRTAESAAIQMPAVGLIFDALAQWGRDQMSGYLPQPQGGRLWGISLASEQDGPPARLAAVLRAVSQAIPRTSGSTGPTGRYEHAAAALYIAISAQPLQGWPIGGFGNKAQAKWARWSAQDAAFSNLILSQIAATPALRQALADPAAAKARIVAAFLSIPSSQIEAAWQQAAAAAQGDLTFDFTGSGPAPVHFVISGSDFQGGPTGWKWSMAGTPWFGEGRINGKQIDLGLESALDKSQSQTSTTGTTTGATTDQGAGGSAGVK